MDAFLAIRDQLKDQLRPVPPASYKGRLIAQIFLGALLNVQSATYLAVWIRDARRSGKSIRILLVQKTDGGRMITVQALYMYALCQFFCGACFVAYRVQAYLSYYHKIPMNHSAISELLALTFSFYATLGYTFANFYSTILLLRRSINVRSTGRLYVMIYNAAFAVSYFGWLATIVPVGINYGTPRDKLTDLTAGAIELLDSVIADPSLLTPETLTKLQEYQTGLLETFEHLLRGMWQLVTLGYVYCGVIALASIVSLVWVYRLRKHARNFREVLNNSKPVVTTMDSGYSCASDANAPPASTSSHPSLGRAPMTEDSLEARQMRVLDRLVSDLTLSVPAVLIMTCYYPICGPIVIANIRKPGWAWQEIRNDVLNWPSLLIPNVIIMFFLYNSWRYPGRYGVNNQERSLKVGSQDTTSAVIRERRLAEAHQLRTLQISVPLDNVIETGGDPFLLEDSEKGTRFSKKDGW